MLTQRSIRVVHLVASAATCALALGSLTWAAPASAAVVRGLSDAELAAHADTIAFGVIVARRFAVRDGRAVTLAELQVYQGLKGIPDGEVITISVPGGELPGGLRAEVPGAPELVVGQMVVGFFETRDGVRRPLGLSLGLLQVLSVGGELRVFRRMQGLHVVGPGGAPSDPSAYVIAGEPLDTYLSRVRGYLGAEPPSRPDGGEVLR